MVGLRAVHAAATGRTMEYSVDYTPQYRDNYLYPVEVAPYVDLAAVTCGPFPVVVVVM